MLKYLDEKGLKILWNKTKEKINTSIINKVDKTTLDNYYDKAAIDKLQQDNSNALALKANAADVFAKKEVTTKLDLKIDTSKIGTANGVASLGSDGKVPSSQLPSYVDDVLEYDNKTAFPETGEGGKIYVDKSTNKTYRWGGTAYVLISSSLALGETSGTAYEGSKGKKNTDDINELKNNKADKSELASVDEQVKTNADQIKALQLSKQDTLVSGTNIKQINGESLLGSGNITVTTDLSNYYTKPQTDEAINNAKTTVKNEILGGASASFNTLKKLENETQRKLNASDGNGTDSAYHIGTGNDTGLTSGSANKLEILKTTSSRGLFSGLSLTNGSIVLVAGHEVGDLTDCVGLMINQSTLSIKKFQDITTPDEYVELLDESMALTTSEINEILI